MGIYYPGFPAETNQKMNNDERECHYFRYIHIFIFLLMLSNIVDHNVVLVSVYTK